MLNEYLKIRHGEFLRGDAPLIRDLYLQLTAGQLHLVLCSIKAVQDTIYGLLSGRLCLSRGSVTFHGAQHTPEQFAKSIAGEAALIGVKSKLVSALDLSENLFLSNMKGLSVRRKEQAVTAQELLRSFQLPLSPSARISSLSLVERIQVELMKACAEERRLIVIDYVISFLTDQERESICGLIGKMCRLGFTFVIVSNYEIELLELADTVTLVVNDATQFVFPKGGFSRELLDQILVGQVKYSSFGIQGPQALPVAFSAEALSGTLLRENSFSISAGETLQIIYTHSAEAEEMFALLQGAKKSAGGGMTLNGRPYLPRDPADAVQQGVGFINASPVQEQLLMHMSLFDNLCIPKATAKNWPIWVNQRYKKSIQEFCLEQLGLQKSPLSLKELPPETLTKILYFKWLFCRPKLLVCFAPFSGEGIGARVAAEEMIRVLSKHGIALLLLTPTSTTVRSYRGRALLLSEGRLLLMSER